MEAKGVPKNDFSIFCLILVGYGLRIFEAASRGQNAPQKVGQIPHRAFSLQPAQLPAGLEPAGCGIADNMRAAGPVCQESAASNQSNRTFAMNRGTVRNKVNCRNRLAFKKSCVYAAAP